MKWIALSFIAAGMLSCAATFTVPSSEMAGQDAAAIAGGRLPAGYRDWRLISVAHEEGNLNDMHAILGNDIAIKACRDGSLPFPDGSIVARVAWNYQPLEESIEVFGRSQSFVSGPPKNGIQFMVKDSKKYASTGGWSFAQFDDGQPVEAAMLKSCFECHSSVKERDLVFNRYSR